MVSNPIEQGIIQHMNLRRMILLLGAVALAVGVIGLLVPVSIAGPNSGSIGCGNGLAANLSAAQQADNNVPNDLAKVPVINQFVPPQSQTNYTTQCQSSLSTRRSWTIPVAVIGLVVMAGSFFVGGRAGARAA
jgi:hypothetical protein